MAFDLLGVGTPSFLRPTLPRIDGAYVKDLELEAGCPSDDALAGIRCIGAQQARRWLDEEFALLAEEIPYATVTTTPHPDEKSPMKRIAFSTGGWSGAEAFINAVTGNYWLYRYVSGGAPGGHYVFHVPTEILDG